MENAEITDEVRAKFLQKERQEKRKECLYGSVFILIFMTLVYLMMEKIFGWIGGIISAVIFGGIAWGGAAWCLSWFAKPTNN